MNSYIYSQIKDSVTMTEILERYGIEVNKGFSLCPFHNEKTPSLKVYEHDFYCFGCGEGGDIIKFVSMYLNVSMSEAARHINDDFGLNLFEKPTLTRRLRQKRIESERKAKLKQKKDEYIWRKNAYFAALDEYIRLDKILIEKKPVDPDVMPSLDFLNALRKIDFVKYKLDCAEMERRYNGYARNI